jgi:hypothetical protein
MAVDLLLAELLYFFTRPELAKNTCITLNEEFLPSVAAFTVKAVHVSCSKFVLSQPGGGFCCIFTCICVSVSFEFPIKV